MVTFQFSSRRFDLSAAQLKSKPSVHYWLLAFFLLILFATGGASRTDTQSLIILRPLAIIACAVACITLRYAHFKGRAWLLVWVAALFILATLHVVPLPPSMWQSLAGRQNLVEVEMLTDLSNIWRPLTLAPMNGWHALVSLFVPLAVILLGIQCHRNDLLNLLPLVIALTTVSGLIGLMQVIGDPQGPLYFYRITNHGWAVGLFANRNHAATLLACLFPMLAVYAATARGENDFVRMRQLVAASIAIVLVPLILVTGSRSGLVSAMIGLVAATSLYRPPTGINTSGRGKQFMLRPLPVLGFFGVLSLTFLTYFFSRAEAIERLFSQSASGDSRTDFWTVSVDLFWKYFPWGSGSGSFVEAFQILEPNYLLDATYLNRAHNDWVEIAVTFGLPGVIGLTFASATFLWRSFQLWRSADPSRRSVAFGRLASVCMAIIAVASVSDYPLRTPTMMGVFAIFALWFTEGGRVRSTSSSSNREGV